MRLNERARRLMVGLLCLSIVAVAGCGGESSSVRSKKRATTSRRAKKVRREYGPEAVPLQFETIACAVYTPEPGFLVLVDGVVARTDDGQPLRTPCEIEFLPGTHDLMLVKEKHEDLVQTVVISSPEDLEFQPAFRPFNTPAGYLASRFAKAKVGEPVPLLYLSTGGAVADPFITDGGKTLYFAGDRKEGRAIYYATRESVFADFGEPVLIRTTRGADIPSCPSVTEDGSLLVYLALDKARLWSVERVSDEFDLRRQVKVGQQEEIWYSAQISADGLRLYCLQEHDGKDRTATTSRKDLDAKFTGEWSTIELPGDHPVLTLDGLRQFAFDGKRLTRTSRMNLSANWSEPKTILELDLPGFERDESRRQFCITDDEQWMFYVDRSEQGNLYAVRVSESPRWGYDPRGRSVPQKTISVAATEPDPETMKPEEKPGEPKADSRTLPLPYASFRETLEALVGDWKFDEAEALVTSALMDPKHVADREVIGWDKEDLQSAREFTVHATEGVKQLRPGDEIRLGPARAEFVRFEDQTLTGKAGGKEIAKAIHELSPNELASLAEKAADRSREEFQLRVAAYNSFQSRPSQSVINSYANRAGASGRIFLARLARRNLHLINQEFDRENIPVGLAMIEEILRTNSRTEAAAEAEQMRESLFTRIEWEPKGSRQWKTESPGEYAAGDPPGPSEGSYLLSPRAYRNFHLSLEWKTVGGSPAQGGVYFRYSPGREIRGNAYKIHFANDFNGPIDRYSTGSLFGREPPKAKTVKPEGEWNSLLLIVKEDQAQATINGTLVLDAKLADGMIPRSGHVALDGQFVGITYRKILLYELPPESKK